MTFPLVVDVCDADTRLYCSNANIDDVDVMFRLPQRDVTPAPMSQCHCFVAYHGGLKRNEAIKLKLESSIAWIPSSVENNDGSVCSSMDRLTHVSTSLPSSPTVNCSRLTSAAGFELNRSTDDDLRFQLGFTRGPANVHLLGIDDLGTVNFSLRSWFWTTIQLA